MVLLKQMAGFQRFLKYNRIDEKRLRICIPHISLVRIAKGEYIFREGSRTKEFFGIIKGQVLITKRKDDYEKILNSIIKNKAKPKDMSSIGKLELI